MDAASAMATDTGVGDGMVGGDHHGLLGGKSEFPGSFKKPLFGVKLKIGKGSFEFPYIDFSYIVQNGYQLMTAIPKTKFVNYLLYLKAI